MALEPYGIVTGPLVNTKRLIASTAGFQAWCRESIVGFPDADDADASYTAALNRVRLGAWDLDSPAVSPFCLVAPLPEIFINNLAVGPTNAEHGTILLKIERNIPDTYLGASNYEDALIDFGGAIEDDTPRGLGLILEQAMTLSELGGTVQIRDFQFMGGPGFNDKDEGGIGIYRCYADVLLLWGIGGGGGDT